MLRAASSSSTITSMVKARPCCRCKPYSRDATNGGTQIISATGNDSIGLVSTERKEAAVTFAIMVATLAAAKL